MEPYENQAAGHQRMEQHTEYPGIIFKPLTKREAAIYSDITSKHEKLASIIPRFEGVFTVEDGILRKVDENELSAIIHAESLKDDQLVPDYYIGLEDLLYGISGACVMDFKLGCKQHAFDFPTEKREIQIRKCQMNTSWKHGFRISGLISTVTPALSKKKDELSRISMGHTFKLIYQILHESRNPAKLKPAIISALEHIMSIFLEQSDYFFISASLLLIFDVYEQDKVTVKLIDLGRTYSLSELLLQHVDLRSDINPEAIKFCEKLNCSLKADCNCIFGLHNLIETFRDVNI